MSDALYKVPIPDQEAKTMLCRSRSSVFLGPAFHGRAARFLSALIAALICVGISPTRGLAQAPTERQLRAAVDRFATSLSALSEALNKASAEAGKAGGPEAIAVQNILRERRQTVDLVHSLAGKLNQAKLGVRDGSTSVNDRASNERAKSAAQTASLAPCKSPCTVSKAQLDVVRAAVSELSKSNVRDDLEALQATLAALQAAAGAALFIPGVGAVIAAILAAIAALIVLIQQMEAKALENEAAAQEAAAARKTERLKRNVAATPCGTPANPCPKRRSSASSKTPDGAASVKRAAPSSSAMDRLSGGSSAPAGGGASKSGGGAAAQTRSSGGGGAGGASSGPDMRNTIRISPGTDIRSTTSPGGLR